MGLKGQGTQGKREEEGERQSGCDTGVECLKINRKWITERVPLRLWAFLRLWHRPPPNQDTNFTTCQGKEHLSPQTHKPKPEKMEGRNTTQLSQQSSGSKTRSNAKQHSRVDKRRRALGTLPFPTSPPSLAHSHSLPIHSLSGNDASTDPLVTQHQGWTAATDGEGGVDRRGIR